MVLLPGLPWVLLILYACFHPLPGLLEEVEFSTVPLDSQGEPLRFFLTEDEQYRVFRPLPNFPVRFKNILLLQEDQNYYWHPGVDVLALARAAWGTYVIGERRYGASTLTMQLVRLRQGFVTRTIRGKLRQIWGALSLEVHYSKAEILEAYMNLAPCGGNLQGFPAASWKYFGKDISETSYSEQLTLATLPQDPLERAPQQDGFPMELVRARQRLAERWEDEGKDVHPLLPVSLVNHFPFRAPHGSESVHFNRLGQEVKTTLDGVVQSMAEEHLHRYVEAQRFKGVKNGAVFIGDWRNMEVLAWVGSANHGDDAILGQVDGVNSRRSPGSTLKPFVYALAMDQGLIIPNTILRDTPTSFNAYTPDNYRSDFTGALPAWRALVDSRNIPAISLAQDLAPHHGLHSLLQSAGITDLKPEEHYGLSIVLGSAELSLWELSMLYAALANDGVAQDWRFFQDEGKSSGSPILSPEAAWLTLKMLEKNPSPIPRPQSNIATPVAFKTGTSIGFKDAWCIAVAGPYVVGTWMGNFDGEGNNALLGRSMAAPLLFKIVDDLLSREETRVVIPPPDGVSQVPLCKVSGAPVNAHCPESVMGWFIPGVSPIKKCTIHREVYVDMKTGYRTNQKGDGVKCLVREFWDSDALEMFAQAGLPRLTPPPYPPNRGIDGAFLGHPPIILHPLDGGSYMLEGQRRTIGLQAAADGDVQQLMWFANDHFLGRTRPGFVQEWSPGWGKWALTAVDDGGRSSTVDIVVEPSPSFLQEEENP
ncbi:MAG: penicillin-binding protein 1C [Spirochaetales bacterium]|nr:penicillin-binding protein 1C [Spirochaetales bacterium]